MLPPSGSNKMVQQPNGKPSLHRNQEVAEHPHVVGVELSPSLTRAPSIALPQIQPPRYRFGKSTKWWQPRPFVLSTGHSFQLEGYSSFTGWYGDSRVCGHIALLRLSTQLLETGGGPPEKEFEPLSWGDASVISTRRARQTLGGSRACGGVACRIVQRKGPDESLQRIAPLTEGQATRLCIDVGTEHSEAGRVPSSHDSHRNDTVTTVVLLIIESISGSPAVADDSNVSPNKGSGTMLVTDRIILGRYAPSSSSDPSQPTTALDSVHVAVVKDDLDLRRHLLFIETRRKRTDFFAEEIVMSLLVEMQSATDLESVVFALQKVTRSGISRGLETVGGGTVWRPLIASVCTAPKRLSEYLVSVSNATDEKLTATTAVAHLKSAASVWRATPVALSQQITSGSDGFLQWMQRPFSPLQSRSAPPQAEALIAVSDARTLFNVDGLNYFVLDELLPAKDS